MRSIICLLAMLTINSFSADIDSLVQQLDNNDFERRETITEQLSEYPEEYINIFKLMADGITGRPEISARLKQVSYNIFIKKVIPKLKKWRQIHANPGFDCVSRYLDVSKGRHIYHYTQNQEFVPDEPMCLVVTASMTEQLNQFDVITEIDGKTPFQFNMNDLLCGDSVKISFRRYANADTLFEQGYTDADLINTEYTEMVTTIEIGYFEPDPDKCEDLIKETWQAYLSEYTQKYKLIP